MQNVIKLLAKCALISLGLTAAASAADAGIHDKILGLGKTWLVISNDEINTLFKKLNLLKMPVYY